jgi:hypothetical protein
MKNVSPLGELIYILGGGERLGFLRLGMKSEFLLSKFNSPSGYPLEVLSMVDKAF